MFRFKILLIFFVVAGLLSSAVSADTSVTLRPIADGGDDSANWNYNDGTACSVTNCYFGVNEASCNEDTSYIESSINGANQTFDIDESSVPNGSTITQIDITVCANRQQGGAKIQTRRCVDGSCANSGSNINLTDSYISTTQSHSGLSIIKSASTDIEIGVANTAAKQARISQTSAVITYKLPVPIPSCGDDNLDPGEECDDGNNNSGDGCSAICQTEIEESPTSSELIFGTGGRMTKVNFSGQAYPGSKIEVLRRGNSDKTAIYLVIPLETHQVQNDGTFDLMLGALVSDEYFFALRAEDKEGRKTGIIAFDVDLKTEDILEAKDIFIAPTIELGKTKVARGKEVYVFGYAAPNNVIEVYIDNLINKTVKADKNGYWTTIINTSNLKVGKYSIKVRQINSSGDLSRFSQIKNLRVSLLQFPQADFNSDDIINITDWSVFLFRWEQTGKNFRTTIDLNGDNKINITDFSMFLNMMKIQ